MDFVRPILEIATCLCTCSAKHVKYISDLEENLNSLRKEFIKLTNLSEDVKRRVELKEQQRFRRTNQVNGWLKSVEDLVKEANGILQKGDQEIQKKCYGSCCPSNCRSSYKLGKMVIKKLTLVKELTDNGNFKVLADRLPPDPVDERPMESTVGAGSEFREICTYLEDENIRIIGIYGMGGVGKTTLLQKTNNILVTMKHSFNVVIWIVVSKEVNLEPIQDAIWKKLGLSEEMWRDKDVDGRAIEIWRVLKTKRFLLLLDDLWARLDLLEVGVPPHDNQNGSKVIFTTRSKDVCYQMGARKKIKVDCLSTEDALDLFNKYVGEDALNSHPQIPKLAGLVAQECKGLPLALITLGRTMASKKNPSDWEYAIKVLKSYPSKFSGMGDPVFPVLRFSFDNLRDNTSKKCFLYCSIYPEDYNISKKELIELWMGEGFLEKIDPYEARDYGENIITNLKLACLIESGEFGDYGGPEEYVKINDVIRDMALWLTCEHGEKENKFLVLTEPQGFARWEKAERISLWSLQKDLTETPFVCPYLQTFKVRSLVIKNFPTGFFESMHALRVLDLLGSWKLNHLPDEIGNLINLHYLNLSGTRIKKLPFELKNLKSLRILLLSELFSNASTPKEVISNLLSLQVFSKSLFFEVRSSVVFTIYGRQSDLLEEQECLECMKQISVILSTLSSIEKIFNFPKLQRCIRGLQIYCCADLTVLDIPSSSLTTMDHLEKLEIYFCYELIGLKIHNKQIPGCEYFRSLHHLRVHYCQSIKDLSWVTHDPGLQMLDLFSCDSMIEVINEDLGYAETEDIFSNLCYNHNYRASAGVLSPFLHSKGYVIDCPRLKKLPFDSSSANDSLIEIPGQRSWWNSLEWENDGVKHFYTSKFVGKG